MDPRKEKMRQVVREERRFLFMLIVFFLGWVAISWTP